MRHVLSVLGEDTSRQVHHVFWQDFVAAFAKVLTFKHVDIAPLVHAISVRDATNSGERCASHARVRASALS
jgi:hypothetical protein